MVEAAGVLELLLWLPRTTMPSRGVRGPSRCTVGTPPE
jgi:hypothetical protein